MDIPARLLTKNHSSVVPSHVLYFDTETEEHRQGELTVHRMKMAWTCTVEYSATGEVRSERWMEWKTSEAMCRQIAGVCYEKTALWIFAHNAFFDLQTSGFFEWFTKHSWELQFVYEAGLTYILVIKKDKRTIKVVSSTNYFQCSLKKLGKMVGLEKLDCDFETVSPADLSIYCHRDVEIVKAAIESYFGFIRRHDLGSFSMTIPSQAMRAFRHRFMPTKIWIHSVERAQKLEQAAYFGGRTECFRLGMQDGGPFVTLDVNSMYPAVMARESVPTQLVDVLDHPDLDWLEDVLREHCVVSRCELDTPEPIYAIHLNKRICFPIGRFSTVLTTPGIQIARARGHLVSLGETAVYKKAVLFRDYVQELYRLRMDYKAKGEETWVYLCKILLNSLYGKWAQKRSLTEVEDCPESEGYRREETLDLVTGKMWLEYQLMNKLVTIQGEEVGKHSFVAISAHITEAARILLWRLIEKAGTQNVLYCDTDSLKVRETDVNNLHSLIHPTTLGALKIEKTSDTLDIWGLKAYSENGVRTIKGIPHSAKDLGNHVYSFTHFLKQASHMRKKQITGMISEEMTKRLNLKYQKGVVLPSGAIAPFDFGHEPLPPLRPEHS